MAAKLKIAVETGSLAVIIGQVGSGKSTMIRSAMHTLDASRYRYIYLASSHLTPAEFYKSLLHQVSVKPGLGVSQNKRLVTQAMLELYQKGIKKTGCGN